MGGGCCAGGKKERRKRQTWKTDGKEQPDLFKGRKEKEGSQGMERWGHQKSRGSRAFRIPADGETPRIPAELRGAPKEVTSRSFQLTPGHAMTASFIKKKFGWLESDTCWWCGSTRQTREHHFKECVT